MLAAALLPNRIQLAQRRVFFHLCVCFPLYRLCGAVVSATGEGIVVSAHQHGQLSLLNLAQRHSMWQKYSTTAQHISVPNWSDLFVYAAQGGSGVA